MVHRLGPLGDTDILRTPIIALAIQAGILDILKILQAWEKDFLSINRNSNNSMDFGSFLRKTNMVHLWTCRCLIPSFSSPLGSGARNFRDRKPIHESPAFLGAFRCLKMGSTPQTMTGWWFGCHFSFSHINSSQLTNSYFFRGVAQPPTCQTISNYER